VIRDPPDPRRVAPHHAPDPGDDQRSALIDALHHHARRSKNPDLLALLKPLRGMRG
jgi:hypothetical protein